MKTVLIAVGILIIGVIGYYSFVMVPNSVTETESQDAVSQAKIDINAVCDGALAYTTFSSGAEADVFVETCKRGEHPEVIEQWREVNGYNDGRAI